MQSRGCYLRYWSHLKTTDFALLNPAQTVVVLPLGAVEQHGPHLPLVVDTAIVDGVIAHTIATAQGVHALFLPTQSTGYSPEHQSFAGTVSLSAQTAIALWTELANAVAKAGLYKLLFLNAHGGNVALMDVVGRELRTRLGLLVYSANWWDLIPDNVWDTCLDTRERRYGVHAGAAETAVIQALAPDLIDTKHIQNFVSHAQARDAQSTMLGRGISKMAWAAQDYHCSGAVGDASAATPALGHRLLETASTGLAQLLCEIAQQPWDKATTTPSQNP